MTKYFSYCTMGVGCEEAGMCFAESQGKPEKCGCPICMWCGRDEPDSGWYSIVGPQALCSEACSRSFKEAF